MLCRGVRACVHGYPVSRPHLPAQVQGQLRGLGERALMGQGGRFMLRRGELTKMSRRGSVRPAMRAYMKARVRM